MIYKGKNLKKIAFPLGGIGTGTVSLSGTGELIDWEIFNRPNKGTILPFSFFSVWAKKGSEKPIAKVLKVLDCDYNENGFGANREKGAGLPHMQDCVFNGKYPFANIDFKDKDLPVKISLEAYNPFIPLDEDNSGIPAAIFNFRIKNNSKKPVTATIAASLFNPIGYSGTGPVISSGIGRNKNEFKRGKYAKGIFMSSKKYKKDHPHYGTIALATPWKYITYQCSWLRSVWFDNLQGFWDEFSKQGVLKNRPLPPSNDGQSDVSTLGLKVKLKPGGSAVLPIYICWHFPTFEKYWDTNKKKPVWKNYYAKKFRNAFDAAEYTVKNSDYLYSRSKLFQKTLFNSTFPSYVIDAISSQASIIKTPTCIRLEDGTFYGFEGCCDKSGCCEGSCTHVWNYAQTPAFLFPSLEKTMRNADYKHSISKDGRMGFRLQLPLGSKMQNYHPAADGQMGNILRVYREWKINGDNRWLKSIYKKVKKSYAYTWKYWDKNKDGVIEGLQHNTYDIEFYGPNAMIGSLYLAASRAMEEMAIFLKDKKTARICRKIFLSGSKWTDKNLFNKEWFIQKINPNAYKLSPAPISIGLGENKKGVKIPKYQFGEGCLSDQLIGQWIAHILGLGYLFDPHNVKQTMKSIFKYNWKQSFKNHTNCQRVYALNNEKGLILCSWPDGKRISFAFPYCDEVWSGVEYQVASHLIYENFLKEGLQIVKGTRERYNGSKRNPFNEIECGHHYARSLASWSLLLALSGFSFDASHKKIGFNPKISRNNFRTFWSINSGWGEYTQKLSDNTFIAAIEVKYGNLFIKELLLPNFNKIRYIKALMNNDSTGFSIKTNDAMTTVIFKKEINLKCNDILAIEGKNYGKSK